MVDAIKNEGNGRIVWALCDAIHEAKDGLSEIDGATGDGDHGVNMNKGFMLAKGRIEESDSLSDALAVLGGALVDDIGGSMGPIYGTFFLTLSDDFDGKGDIDAVAFGKAIADAAEALMDLAGAKPGDKTLVDTVLPASKAFADALEDGKDFKTALMDMSNGAETGWQSTKDMQARIGRAARLGARSIGHFDAGATSCRIILQTLAKEFSSRL